MHCNTLQRTATHCNIFLLASHRSFSHAIKRKMQCNALQHALQHTSACIVSLCLQCNEKRKGTTSYMITLQRTATHTATPFYLHCITLSPCIASHLRASARVRAPSLSPCNCNTLQYILQQNATHTATYTRLSPTMLLQHATIHTAAHCNAHCNTHKISLSPRPSSAPSCRDHINTLPHILHSWRDH